MNCKKHYVLANSIAILKILAKILPKTAEIFAIFFVLPPATVYCQSHVLSNAQGLSCGEYMTSEFCGIKALNSFDDSRRCFCVFFDRTLKG